MHCCTEPFGSQGPVRADPTRKIVWIRQNWACRRNFRRETSDLQHDCHIRTASPGLPPLWLDAPADTLIARVGARRGDASDADAGVVQSQLARPTGAMSWARVDAREDREATLTAAAAKLPPAIMRD